MQIADSACWGEDLYAMSLVLLLAAAAAAAAAVPCRLLDQLLQAVAACCSHGLLASWLTPIST
jgi:hypothetical protein